MVTLANHGGSCCGARHLYNFDTIANGTTRGTAQEQILTALREAPIGRRIEVILNERQVTSTRGREILDTLARLGFVLAEQYLNRNHNPPRKNFVFTRCDTRRRTDERLPFTWSGQWLTPNLTGNLPAIPRITPTAPAAPAGVVGYEGPLPNERVDVTGIIFGRPVDISRPICFEDGTPAHIVETARGDSFRPMSIPTVGRRAIEGGREINNGSWYTVASGGYVGDEHRYQRVANFTYNTFAIGDRVIITSPNSENRNRSGEVIELLEGLVRVRLQNGYGTFSFRPTSLRKAATTPAPLVIEPQRHEQGAPPVVANHAPPPPVEVPPRVVYTTFHNVLQRGTGAGWETLEDCRAAAPRCRQQLRRDIMSDGEVVDTPL